MSVKSEFFISLAGGRSSLGKIENKKIGVNAVLIFTMDSTDQYVQNSKKGGPAGEILVRKSLEFGLERLGIAVKVATSDGEFLSLMRSNPSYDIIFLDPWTWADPGWVLKPALSGLESRIFLLDFFGKSNAPNNLKIPPSHIMTAYPLNPYNTFLGYYVNDPLAGQKPVIRENAGIIWAKSPQYIQDHKRLLLSLAESTILYSTVSSTSIHHKNIIYLGHLQPSDWKSLLAKSKFLLGLGDPVLGPSAVEAVMAGCVYINPNYPTPKVTKSGTFPSQHPYLGSHSIDFSHLKEDDDVFELQEHLVCSYEIDNVVQAEACVKYALNLNDMKRKWNNNEYSLESYLKRLSGIFSDYAQTRL